jgi:TctA family transporter
MFDFSIIFTISILVGIVVGLLPGLPIWIGPMFLLPFIDHLSMFEIMIFWTGCSLGGQFFGSVSSLLLRIPGESSSLIYLNDIQHLSWAQRVETIRQTAWGSFVASIMALVVMLGVSMIDPKFLLSLGTFNVKFFIYVSMILALIALSEQRAWAVFLMVAGLVLSEKTNYSLPVWVLQTQRYWDDITILSVMLGLIVIPEWLRGQNELRDNLLDFKGYQPTSLEWGHILKGSAVGSVMGLVPSGATISAWSSYKVFKGSISQRIIAAESANNSGIIAGMFPFLIFGIPFGLDQVAINTLLEIKNIEMPRDVFINIYGSFNHFDMLMLVLLIMSGIYFVLSQRFIVFYTQVVRLLHTRLWMVYVAIICGIIYVDISYSVVDATIYFMYLCLLTVVGLWMNKRSINPLPLVLGFVLGDQFAWATYHFISL